MKQTQHMTSNHTFFNTPAILDSLPETLMFATSGKQIIRHTVDKPIKIFFKTPAVSKPNVYIFFYVTLYLNVNITNKYD